MIELKTIFTHRKDVSEKRLRICEECEHFVKKTTRCEQCGCFMFAKTLLMKAECPIGKWKKEEEWQPQN